jgi:hypothetical protein
MALPRRAVASVAFRTGLANVRVGAGLAARRATADGANHRGARAVARVCARARRAERRTGVVLGEGLACPRGSAPVASRALPQTAGARGACRNARSGLSAKKERRAAIARVTRRATTALRLSGAREVKARACIDRVGLTGVDGHRRFHGATVGRVDAKPAVHVDRDVLRRRVGRSRAGHAEAACCGERQAGDQRRHSGEHGQKSIHAPRSTRRADTNDDFGEAQCGGAKSRCRSGQYTSGTYISFGIGPRR